MLSSGEFGEKILYSFEAYIAKMQRNISADTLSCSGNSPSLPYPETFPEFLVWHVYSTQLCTLITLQIHTTPEHIKASSVHLLLFRPQTVLKEGRVGGKKSTQICRYVFPLVIFTPVSGDIISLSHFSLHEFTSGHWKALQRCQQHQCLKTSPQVLARSLKELWETTVILQMAKAVK